MDAKKGIRADFGFCTYGKRITLDENGKLVHYCNRCKNECSGWMVPDGYVRVEAEQ